MRKGQAGYSATRRARQLRREHVVKALKTGGVAGAAGTVLAATTFGGLSVVSLAAGGAAWVASAAWLSRKPSEAARWLQGAKAEERTGQILASLKHLGWGVLHDRSIPNSKANLDHIGVHPSGAFLVYIDTKAYHAANARVYWDGQRLMYGRYDQTEKLNTVRWEASRLAEGTGLRVVPVIAIDGGKVIADPSTPGVIVVDGLYVVSSANLLNLLAFVDQLSGPNPARVRDVIKNIERKFPAAQ